VVEGEAAIAIAVGVRRIQIDAEFDASSRRPTASGVNAPGHCPAVQHESKPSPPPRRAFRHSGRRTRPQYLIMSKFTVAP
jgi:hypothetical protein